MNELAESAINQQEKRISKCFEKTSMFWIQMIPIISKDQTHDINFSEYRKSFFKNTNLKEINPENNHDYLFSMGAFEGGFCQHLCSLLNLDKGMNTVSSVMYTDRTRIKLEDEFGDFSIDVDGEAV